MSTSALSTTGEAANVKPFDLRFPPGYEYLFERHRYKGAYGGRGSSKSWSIARALILAAVNRPERILCARELQNSISESVHRLLCDQIEIMGLGAYFQIQDNGIYRYPYQREIDAGISRGSEFFFYGIRTNPTKVKSTEGVTKCWVEEAEKVSHNSWEILIPTIREPGSEIWISFNPDEENDPTYQRFVVNMLQLPDAVIREFNWQDNPWFPETLRQEKDYLYRVDPDAAAHVWGGQCRKNGSSQIFRGKYVVEAFTPPNEDTYADPKLHWDGPYFGADWGFSQDPSTLVKCWIDDNTCGKGKRLFIEHEAYGVGVELDDTPALFKAVPGCGTRKILADCSRPETISHVARHGEMLIEGAEKWSGSVEDGVAFLRSFEQIIIHPRCVHAEQEARLYSFKVDRLTSQVTTEIVDKHNHIWDALRYALQPLIMSVSNLSTWAKL
jgi:phage terminase large subunit